MSITRTIITAIVLSMLASSGCSSYSVKGGGNNDNMGVKGMFRFDVMQNEAVDKDYDARLAMCGRVR